jgi:hypothetical protein
MATDLSQFTVPNNRFDVAQDNAAKLDSVVNGPNAVVTTRTGKGIQSIDRIIESIAAVTDRGPWATATSYQVKDLVTDTGIFYIAVTAHTSGATFAGDVANWRVYQSIPQVQGDERYGVIFDTTVAMQASSPTVGQRLSTNEFSTGNEGGADYITEVGDTSNGFDRLLLANGNTAVLQIDASGEVSILQFGPLGIDHNPALQAAIDFGKPTVLPEGFDLLINPATISWAAAPTFIVYGLVNGRSEALDLRGGNKLIFDGVRKRTVLRTVDFDTNGYGTEKDSKAGSALRIDAKSVRGDSAVFLNTNGRKPLISDDHFVGIHSLFHNGAAVPEIWGINPVLVKDVDSAGSDTSKASLYGVEVTLSNNTAEAGPALGLGAVTGFFASYGNVTGNASAGFATGGLTSGWNEGIHLDGISTTGKGIVLADDVAPNNGMSVGLDCSSVSSFSTAAILLGNNQKLVGLNAVAAGKSLVVVNGADEAAIGDSSINMRLQFADLKITGPTLGGSAAFPANFDAVLFANIGGTAYKIPLIAV